MNAPERLSIEEVEAWRNLAMSDSLMDGEAGFYARAMYFAGHLVDTMRENEALKSQIDYLDEELLKRNKESDNG